MKRDKLETYLGKKVTVTFREGDSATGVLTKGMGFEDGYYQCSGINPFWFRSSHVRRIEDGQ
jgi:hypothetical protein